MNSTRLNLRHKTLNSLWKSLRIALSFLLSLSRMLSATSSVQEDTKESLYELGINYKNEKKFKEAISCFTPLAEKGDVKSQHNLAFCFYALDHEQEAYSWYKRAKYQDFTPSNNNLKKMNLFFLLLPNEILSYIASCLFMNDLSHFKSVSERAHHIFDSVVTRTNFLVSKRPYANDFRMLFSKVTFEPQRREIKWVRSAEASTLEVHFRDPNHLRKIIEETPHLKSKNNLYFVQDKDVEDNKELIAVKGNLVKKYFIHIMADIPIKLTGEITSPFKIVLPFQSDLKKLIYNGKSISCGDSKSYQAVHNLATTIETFDEQLFKIRTADAYSLLEDRQKKCLDSPELFPEFSVFCPQAYFISHSDINIVQKDYISATKPLIYRANSLSALNKMQSELIDFYSAIYYVDPNCGSSGIYCLSPLFLIKGFEIFAEKDLIMTGIINLYDYNIKIKSKNSFWKIGGWLEALAITINAHNLTLHGTSL